MDFSPSHPACSCSGLWEEPFSWLLIALYVHKSTFPAVRLQLQCEFPVWGRFYVSVSVIRASVVPASTRVEMCPVISQHRAGPASISWIRVVGAEGPAGSLSRHHCSSAASRCPFRFQHRGNQGLMVRDVLRSSSIFTPEGLRISCVILAGWGAGVS